LTGREPTFERGRAFAALPASEQTFDADMFINVGPLNRCAASENIAISTLGIGGVQKPRIPFKWNADHSAVIERDTNAILVRLSADGTWFSFKD
jgi:hypothetical protein